MSRDDNLFFLANIMNSDFKYCELLKLGLRRLNYELLNSYTAWSKKKVSTKQSF